MKTIWNVVLKALLKKGLLYESDDIDLSFVQDGMKVNVQATNVRIRFEKDK